MNFKNDMETGTIFSIPLENDSWALGQVLKAGVNFLGGVPLIRFREPLSPNGFDGQDISLIFWTNDAEIYRGSWRIIGNANLNLGLAFPEYRIFVDGRECVEDAAGRILRSFDPARDSKLRFKKVRSPKLVERAVKAAFGIGDWNTSFDDMTFQKDT